MYIENSINEKYIRSLNLGCFPKNVLNFQESQDYFQQLIFIDYQLQLLIQNELNNKELVTINDFQRLQKDARSNDPKGKLIQLINYTNSIHLNYQHETNSRIYEENLYYINLMANLLYLDGNLPEMNRLLSSITVSHQVNKTSQHANVSQNVLEFIQYLTCRYYVLLGLSLSNHSTSTSTSNNNSNSNSNNTQVWFDYLAKFNKPFSKSQVVANHWLDLMFRKLALAVSQNGTIPLSFTSQVSNLPFFKNKLSAIAFSNFLLRPENLRLTNKSFKSDYASYLTIDINECIHLQIQFPNASDTNTQVNDFINNLYETMSYVPFNLAIFKPSLSKSFLVDATKKTYQSRIVLSNLIYTLIDLNEYDEALVAFKTYIAYLEKDEEQKDGYIEDILAIIDTYSTCIIHFNPLKSFKNHKKFKYSDEQFVVNELHEFAKSLKRYMDKLAELIDLTYDDENYAGDRNPLSFLYRKYNLNVLQSDHSQFIELISKAWHSLGYYHYYFAVEQSANQKILDGHVREVMRNYKNSLIVNSTGNVLYLFTYALALANSGELKSSLKLCKLILKKYPESFKTWNLLVLLISSFNNDNAEVIKPAGAHSNILPDNLLSDEEKYNGVANLDQKVDSYVAPTPEIREPEKFINKALNISGLYILKHQQKDIKLTTDAKYEILQLKMTQLAVLESIHGPQYMIDYISEVFVLFHELFDVKLASNLANTSSSRQYGSGEKWSHRPSVIDPKVANGVSTSTPTPIPMQPESKQSQNQKQGDKESSDTGFNPPRAASPDVVSEHKLERVQTSKRSNAVDKLKRFSKLPMKEVKDAMIVRRDSVASYGSNDSGPRHIRKPDFMKRGGGTSSPPPPSQRFASTGTAATAYNDKTTTTTATAAAAATSKPKTILANANGTGAGNSPLGASRSNATSAPAHRHDNLIERKLLQEIWLWTARIFLKVGLLDECEQSIIEEELVYEPNYKTFIATGNLHSKSKKFLALLEFERSLEILDKNYKFNKIDYGYAILGLAKLVLVDDKLSNSLFISTRDMDAAIIRLKNLLEQYSISWPYGVNNPEVWFYLSKIYEIIDDKILLTKSLWKCIELEDVRPVRAFEICNFSI